VRRMNVCVYGFSIEHKVAQVRVEGLNDWNWETRQDSGTGWAACAGSRRSCISTDFWHTGRSSTERVGKHVVCANMAGLLGRVKGIDLSYKTDLCGSKSFDGVPGTIALGALTNRDSFVGA